MILDSKKFFFLQLFIFTFFYKHFIEQKKYNHIIKSTIIVWIQTFHSAQKGTYIEYNFDAVKKKQIFDDLIFDLKNDLMIRQALELLLSIQET